MSSAGNATYVSSSGDGFVSVPPPRDPRADWFRRFIVDYNPFFLLSALLMLGGSLALTNSVSWSPQRLQRILILTAAVNAYELILVTLGLFLVLRRGARRDGSILLILEAFFLVDVAFLNAEIFAIDRWVGLIAGSLMLTLSLAKLMVIFRVLRISPRHPLVACALAEVVALYALPGVLKFTAAAHGGVLPPMAMLLIWWSIAALGAMCFAFPRYHSHRGLLPWFAPLLSILAGVSLLAHAGTGQWVYDLPYWGAHLAPILVLAAFVLCHHPPLRAAGIAIACLAVLASTHFDHRLTVRFLGHSLTPMYAGIATIYLSLAWTLARAAFGRFVAAGACVAAFRLLGPSPTTIRGWGGRTIEWVVDRLDAMRPRTQDGWGVVCIAMSFVFLVVGTVVSLRRSESVEPNLPTP